MSGELLRVIRSRPLMEDAALAVRDRARAALGEVLTREQQIDAVWALRQGDVWEVRVDPACIPDGLMDRVLEEISPL